MSCTEKRKQRKLFSFCTVHSFLPAQAFLPVSSFLSPAFLSVLHLFFFFLKCYFKFWERFSLLNSESNFLHLFMAAITFLHCIRIRLVHALLLVYMLLSKTQFCSKFMEHLLRVRIHMSLEIQG